MASFDEIASRDGPAAHDSAFAAVPDTDASETVPSLNDAHSIISPDRHLVRLRQTTGLGHRINQKLMKPLFAVVTAQSILVAVVVCLAAVITAQYASQIIGEKFVAINAALKRF